MPAFAGESCTIEVYPFEGGKYTLQGGRIVSCVVQKSIVGDARGTFTIVLAPGGPQGPESVPTWSQVVTPMSLVLIGMQRGDNAAIVMMGVVRSASESQDWGTSQEGSSSVTRLQYIQGDDFTAYFTAFNYVALTMFGISYGTPFAQAVGLPLSGGFPALVGQGAYGGTSESDSNPAIAARAWFDNIMLGSGGIMGRAFVPYLGGSRVLLSTIFERIWENYPVFIPLATTFLAAEGSWMAKFQDILPWPWYEFFVVTAPIGAYGGTIASGTTIPGKPFTMSAMALAQPVSPIVVGRVNPQPLLKVTGSGANQAITLGSIDMSRWSKLTVFALADDGVGFFSSGVGFSTDEVRNLYFVNPTAYAPLYGNGNANTVPFTYLFTALGDSASIHRYGYRPEFTSTPWMFDPQGTAGQNPQLNVPFSVAEMTARVAGMYHPTPLMARGTTTIPLRPDVLAGNIWRYPPFKGASPTPGGSATWDFYIDGFRHEFVFGGRSQTVLTLSRGLPTSVYADPSDGGLLQSIWLGNAQRVNGGYEVGLPQGTGPGLESVGNTPNSILEFMAHIGQSYVTPQTR